jgi:hypothetical protein
MVVAAALACATGMAFAGGAAPTSPFRVYGAVGTTVGGDDLTSNSTSTITAGGLVQLSVGGDYRWSQTFSTQASIGYHISADPGPYDNSSFQRFPIELLGYYHINDKWRVGGGMRYVTNAKLKVENDYSYYSYDPNGTYRAKNTVGLVVEGEWLFARHVGLKVRGVSEKYEFANRPAANGSHLGVFVSFYI